MKFESIERADGVNYQALAMAVARAQLRVMAM